MTTSSRKSPRWASSSVPWRAVSRGGKVTRGSEDLGAILPSDHRALEIGKGVVEGGGVLEVLRGGGQVAHSQCQHPDPAVRVRRTLPIPRNLRLGEHSLERHLRLAQPPIGLQDVASARVQPGETGMIVRGLEDYSGAVVDDQRGIVVLPKAEDEAVCLEAMSGKPPLADLPSHHGAAPDDGGGARVPRNGVV